MKIGIVGSGALGSFYGAKLSKSGFDVRFLLRSDFEAVQQRGIFIRSVDGDFHIRPPSARYPEQIGRCDLVIVGLKTTANDQFSSLLSPLVDGETSVLTLQNGLGNEAALAQLFGPQNVLGGLCFVCLNRIEPGVVHHIGHGSVVIGEYQRRPETRTEEIAGAFRQAGVLCEVTDDLEQSHWEKLVWNIPFNGLGVASCAGYEAVVRGQVSAGAPLGPCLSTDQLLADPHWAALVRELMHEVIEIARALQCQVPFSLADVQIERTLEMGAYHASTLIDFKRNKPLELQSLFLLPLQHARKAGVSAPRLAALSTLLAQLERRRCVGSSERPR
jgi:2-dehydropantoate 2-reductase